MYNNNNFSSWKIAHPYLRQVTHTSQRYYYQFILIITITLCVYEYIVYIYCNKTSLCLLLPVLFDKLMSL